MGTEELFEVLDRLGARLQGHFLLSSGNHSDTYLQCARLYEWPDEAARLSEALAAKLRDQGYVPATVVGPALGAILVAYELSRALGVRNLFAERGPEGQLGLRRSFSVEPGEKIVVVEDVVTTGKSAKETLELLRSLGAEPIAVASIIDRSGGSADFGLPFVPLLQVEANLWSPEECPLCKKGVEVVKPGSRKLPG